MRWSTRGALLLAALTLFILGRPGSSEAQTASPAQYYAAGNRLYSAHNFAQAAQYYSAATKVDPNYAPAYQGLGNCYYALGRRSDALAFYQRALALNPNNAQLAQFVQNLQAQLGQASPSQVATPTMMQQGMTLMKQRQYADSIPFFQQAIADNPNDYRPYYYAAYASAMVRDNKNAALYFGLANQKSPNSQTQAMAYRYKASLNPDDQDWVNQQLAKASQGGAIAGVPVKFTPQYGFHIYGGGYDVLSDPSDIVNGASVGQIGGFSNAVSLTGQTPAWGPVISFEPYYQFNQMLEVNLNFSYLPAGSISYQWFDLTPNGQSNVDNYQYVFGLSMVNIGLGLRANFADPGSDTVPYLTAGGDISPVNLSFDKTQIHSDGSPDISTKSFSDNFTGTAFGAHGVLGVDFKLSNELLLGPYLEYRYVKVSSFKDASGAELKVDTKSGDVTTPSTAQGAKSEQPGGAYVPFTLDMSGLAAGVNMTLVF